MVAFSFVSSASPKNYYKEKIIKPAIILHYPELVKRFYSINGNNGILNFAESTKLQKDFLIILDSSIYLGLYKNHYHYQDLFQPDSLKNNSAIISSSYNLLFTDALISFIQDLYTKNNNKISDDEISKKYEQQDDEFILKKMISIQNGESIADIVKEIEPSDNIYCSLKNELKIQTDVHDTDKIKQLIIYLNYYRWINHFHFEKFIVVNIPSAILKYYQADTIALSMKVVTGKPSTKTPRFAAYCNEVVLYPYWNVPSSIALKEILPVIKAYPKTLKALHMQVLNSRGVIIHPEDIDWSKYSRNNFPYSFRQSTGCDNSLGVIKFNLTDPFSVYLHDTNNKLAFEKQERFLSHGCIRVEKPLELANSILPTPVDSSYIRACLKDQQPVLLQLDSPIPVFVIYSTVDLDINKEVEYYNDIYRLANN